MTYFTFFSIKFKYNLIKLNNVNLDIIPIKNNYLEFKQ